uniref:Shugoshin_C domain-containing protein n=1 Tax=Syphacia muris TaxID=451379 RepID=A0A0N5AGQ0_9BILA
MDNNGDTQFSFLNKKGIASAFAQANRSLIEKNKLLQAEVLASKAESDRLRTLNAELRAKISILESGPEDERMRCIVERRLKRKFVRFQLIAKRAATCLENVLKEFDNVFTSESLLPELDFIAKKTQSRQSIISCPNLETVEESPMLLRPITKENFFPVKNDDLNLLPSSSETPTRSDVVNDSLEDIEGDRTLNCSAEDLEKIEKCSENNVISTPVYGGTTALLSKGTDSPESANGSFQESKDLVEKENTDENVHSRYFEPTKRRRGRRLNFLENSSEDTCSVSNIYSSTVNESSMDSFNSRKSKHCTENTPSSSGKKSGKRNKMRKTKDSSYSNNDNLDNEELDLETSDRKINIESDLTANSATSEELISVNQDSHRPSRSCCKTMKSYKPIPLNRKLRRP